MIRVQTGARTGRLTGSASLVGAGGAVNRPLVRTGITPRQPSGRHPQDRRCHAWRMEPTSGTGRADRVAARALHRFVPAGGAVAVLVFISIHAYVIVRIFVRCPVAYLRTVGGARWQAARGYAVVRDRACFSVASTITTCRVGAVMHASGGECMGGAPAQHGIGARSDPRHGVDDRLIGIATVALRKAKERGLACSYERQDWLVAKAEFEGREGARCDGRLP
jgi:hypothetical protein